SISRSSLGHTYTRRRGVPSAASMRSGTRVERRAVKSSTGMLTKPKVSVPDQIARGAAGAPSGNVPPRRFEALAQRVRERRHGGLGGRSLELGRLSARLGLDQRQHALAVLVAVGIQIELVHGQDGNELVGELRLERVDADLRRRAE